MILHWSVGIPWVYTFTITVIINTPCFGTTGGSQGGWIKNAVILDMRPHGLVEIHRCFRGTYCLHLQGSREVVESLPTIWRHTWETVFFNLFCIWVQLTWKKFGEKLCRSVVPWTYIINTQLEILKEQKQLQHFKICWNVIISLISVSYRLRK